MRINTNIPAIQSYNALQATNNALAKSINKLSTGLRINSAADDAAGLAISEKMRAQYNGLDRAASNAQDGISMIQTAEGALNETHSILQRMRELSVQAANDTLTQEDRSYIQLEVDQLKEEISRISTTTQFNRKQLLDGSAAAIWSSDKLSTKAIINGGLRSIDQFGQKNAVEGNYKITVKTTPGQGQVQKSDIFKIKHQNVVMGLVVDKEKGVDSVRVDNLPAGSWTVKSYATAAAAGATDATGGANAFADNAAVLDVYHADSAKTAGALTLTGNALESIDGKGENAKGINLNVLFEVESVDTTSGNVTFKVSSMGLDTKGNSVTYNGDTIVARGGAAIATGTYTNIGLKIGTAGITLSAADTYSKGDKFVVSVMASDTTPTAFLAIKGTLNDSWDEKWTDANGIGNAYGLAAAEVKDKEVHFKQYYLNTENGTVHVGDTIVQFNDKLPAAAAAADLASFEAAYVGQVAKGDVALRDLDKFWDANGKFMLQDPKTITLTQGDGTSTSVTLYSTDTLEDVRAKLNGAVANGLGQGKYVTNNTNNFVSFVENLGSTANTSESVEGTFVVRSVVPGAAGKINFSGDEDIIKAFSLNEIQGTKESQYEVTIVDAHSGNMVASGAKVTGNKLVGVLHENVDVVFDPMANVKVEWNNDSKKFNVTRSDDEYTTILHLSDNTTVFQIGANEGEDMGVNIGDMSAAALGVDKLIVTDRESAASAITTIDNAINKVSKQRAMLGAYQNRLEHTINNLTTSSTNLKSSESRIRDADMAKEMMEFTKLNILSNAGNSMLAQANNLPQSVLMLLR